MKTAIIGICGGSGSGKTSCAERIIERLGKGNAVLLSQDSYYRDLSHLDPSARDVVNFDHPDAIDWDLFSGHIRTLAAGGGVAVPVYDFKSHSRVSSRQQMPARVIVVEGHLILSDNAVRDLLGFKVYLDASPDILLMRRTRRDMDERGRDVGSVFGQYSRTVRPMHIRFVEPSRQFADLTVSAEAGRDEIAELVWDRIASWRGPFIKAACEAEDEKRA